MYVTKKQKTRWRFNVTIMESIKVNKKGNFENLLNTVDYIQKSIKGSNA